MMSLTGRTADAATSYYVHMSEDAHRPGGELSREDYYAREGVGQWHGAGAEALGLAGEVRGDDFAELAAGWAPDGSALSQNAGEPDRRAGWDATFSAPKSVSVVWAIADEGTSRAIEQAHDAAVSRALDYLQDHAILTRRGSGGHRQERAQMVAAVFRHGTSREQDPQLHSHAFIMNAARRDDGSWGTVESKKAFVLQKIAGAMYRSELAAQLREQGYEIEADRFSFRLAHVPRALERDFSKRRQQVEEELARRGVSGARASEAATLSTRRAKEHIDSDELRKMWAEVGREFDFTHEHAAPGGDVYEIEPPTPADVLEIVTEKDAVVSGRDITLAATVAAQHAGMSADQAEALAEAATAEAVQLADGRGGLRYTSQDLIDAERDIMRIAANGSTDTRHRLDIDKIDAAMARVAEREGYRLSPEQQAGVRHLVSESGSVAVMIGDAGTGKSTSMQAIREAYEAAGMQVLGTAPSGKAAAELSQSTGIDAYTLDSMLARVEHGKFDLDERSVIVLDEAGMVGSRKMHMLLAAAESSGAKVMLVGDPKQLQPVEAGAMLRHLADHERGVGHVRIQEIYRQRDEADREAVRQMSRGEAAQAMVHYIDRGQVSVRSTHQAAVNDIARKYLAAADEAGREQAVALASTNTRVDAINDRIRDQLKQRGELNEAREFEALREEERERKTGEIKTTTERTEYAVGDRVLFAGSNDYRSDLRRGDLGEVVGIEDDRLAVRLDRDGETRTIDPAQQDIRHGYAITTHRAQGATVERTIVYASSDLSREMAYVQASRAREVTEWVTTRHSVKSMSEHAGEREQGQEQCTGLDPRLAEFRGVVEAMSRSRQAESTVDYIYQQQEKAMTEKSRQEELTAYREQAELLRQRKEQIEAQRARAQERAESDSERAPAQQQPRQPQCQQEQQQRDPAREARTAPPESERAGRAGAQDRWQQHEQRDAQYTAQIEQERDPTRRAQLIDERSEAVERMLEDSDSRIISISRQAGIEPPRDVVERHAQREQARRSQREPGREAQQVDRTQTRQPQQSQQEQHAQERGGRPRPQQHQREQPQRQTERVQERQQSREQGEYER